MIRQLHNHTISTLRHHPTSEKKIHTHTHINSCLTINPTLPTLHQIFTSFLGKQSPHISTNVSLTFTSITTKVIPTLASVKITLIQLVYYLHLNRHIPDNLPNISLTLNLTFPSRFKPTHIHTEVSITSHY